MISEDIKTCIQDLQRKSSSAFVYLKNSSIQLIKVDSNCKTSWEKHLYTYIHGKLTQISFQQISWKTIMKIYNILNLSSRFMASSCKSPVFFFSSSHSSVFLNLIAGDWVFTWGSQTKKNENMYLARINPCLFLQSLMSNQGPCIHSNQWQESYNTGLISLMMF